MLFKVYQHRRKDTDEIFYVGHGKKSRPWQFTRGRNSDWQLIYNQFGCRVEIVAKFETKQEAADFEISLIDQYKKAGISLVNKKAGGFDRNQGLPLSNATKQKISKALSINNASRKKTQTPLGIFPSKVEAARAHQIHIDTIGYRIRHWEGYEFV